MYANITNPANFQLQDFAQFGFRVITTDFIPVPGEQYRTLYVLQDAVVTATTQKGDDITSKAILAGTLLHGLFNSVSITSGRVLAYAAGRVTAEEIIALYEAYVIALGGTLENAQCAVDTINEDGVDFFADASLVMIPEGYATGVVYGQRPLTSDSQLTFTRASTATRVGPDGAIAVVGSNVPRIDYTGGGCGKLLLEPQRTNLVTFSEQINNAAWTKLDTSVTANAGVSPDGYTNADKIVPNTTSTPHILYQSISTSNTYTFSVFAKAAGQNFLTMRLDDDSPEINVFFNLSTGTIGSTAGGSPTMTSYGNGWYRCSVTYTPSGTETIYAVLGSANVNGSISYAGNGTDGILLYGAQLEAGSYATSYIPTTAAAVTRLADVCSKTGISSLIGQTEGTLFVDINYNGNKDVAGSVPIRIYTGINEAYIFITNANALQCELYDITQQCIITGSIGAVGRKKIAFAYKQNDFVVYMNGVQIGTDTSGTVGTMANLVVGGYLSGTNYITLNGINQALLFKTRLTNAQLAELTTL